MFVYSALPKPLLRPDPERPPDGFGLPQIEGLPATAGKTIQFRKDLERVCRRRIVSRVKASREIEVDSPVIDPVGNPKAEGGLG